MQLIKKIRKHLQVARASIARRVPREVPTSVLERVLWVGYRYPRALKVPALAGAHTTAFFEYSRRMDEGRSASVPDARKRTREGRRTKQVVGFTGARGRPFTIDVDEVLECYPIPRPKKGEEIEA